MGFSLLGQFKLCHAHRAAVRNRTKAQQLFHHLSPQFLKGPTLNNHNHSVRFMRSLMRQDEFYLCEHWRMFTIGFTCYFLL